MRYLKTYEDWDIEHEIKKYKKGDYVLVNLGGVGDYGIKNEPMLLITDPERHDVSSEEEGFTIVGKLLRPYVLKDNPLDNNNSMTLFDYELGEKISK